ncbi:EEF1A lysine methyltransferase 1-like isoform X2 [Mercenaria mercenaria]|uniref:EEF1A lysine methyltransferase 1-like isoform X2 n=1 Tax=Mercenaria mercenaria TaxID=6596 RepID=UPI001E1D6CE1|nr:EEF1A lysine methyltransferase 1-like isoform X2 [Mercenaria mercenaria]
MTVRRHENLMSDTDDDVPTLSADTLAALNEFYAEQTEEQKMVEAALQTGQIKDIRLQEDWQLSQFWYTDDTAQRLAEEVLSIAGKEGRIACISAPTAYTKIKEIKPDKCSVTCLEFDRRFEIYGEDFQYYDYNEPLNLPLDMKQSFDIVIADPPFLSEECLCKTAVTAKFLTKGKIILCTGAVMQEAALKLLDARPCSFLPKHKNNLQNDFRCYTNYDSIFLNKS